MHIYYQMLGDTADTSATVPQRLKIAGIPLRSTFLIVPFVLVAHLSTPQSATIWSAYETPKDLIRMTLGFGVCLSISIQLFRIPKDPEAYRIWVYLGTVGTIFVLICAAVIW